MDSLKYWGPSKIMRVVPVAVVLGIFGLLATPIAASAETTVTVSNTGASWTYFPVNVTLANPISTTVHGTVAPGGGCIFKGSGSGISGAGSSTQIETAIDVASCTAVFESGSPVGTPSNVVATGTSSSTSTKGTPAAGGDTDPSATQNNQWLDPLGIQVNAQAQTVNWTTDGSQDTSWNETVNWSWLSADGWTTRWTSDNSNGGQPANSLANSSFQNSIFCAPFTTYSYFGWNGTSPVNDELYGYADGTYSWNYTDYVNGGCSTLLHHGHTDS